MTKVPLSARPVSQSEFLARLRLLMQQPVRGCSTGAKAALARSVIDAALMERPVR